MIFQGHTVTVAGACAQLGAVNSWLHVFTSSNCSFFSPVCSYMNVTIYFRVSELPYLTQVSFWCYLSGFMTVFDINLLCVFLGELAVKT